MKYSIFLILLILIVPLLCGPIILTYIIEHQIDQPDTFVQLTLKVQSQGKSLKTCISQARRIISGIEEIAERHCKQKLEDEECQEIVDVSNFEVEPKYHLVRKIQTFTLFILSHQLTVSIKNLQGLGKLADEIIREGQGLVTLEEFAWKAAEELDPEKETIREGIQEGRELCEKFGKGLSQFVSVQELEVPEGEGEEEERDEDLAEVEVETTIFKFKVKCEEGVEEGKKEKGKKGGKEKGKNDKTKQQNK